jgi:hypothetical protein
MTYSFGAIPMSSRSNSTVFGSFVCEALLLSPRRPRVGFPVERLDADGFFMVACPTAPDPRGSGVRR